MPILWIRRAAVPAVLALALLTAACNDSDSPTEPRTDSIAIESITPASTTNLQRGTQVTIALTARYTLASASDGRISLVIQDQTNQNIAPLPQPMAQVPRGQGTVTLTNTFTVPAGASSVRVFVPLTPQGATQTSTVASVTYNVTS